MKLSKIRALSLLLICCSTTALAQISYTAADSCRIVDILQKSDRCSTIDIATQFIGLPYIAGTLDKEDNERLTVNIREFDCTTFVEQITAMTITANNKGESFEEFCCTLNKLRYRNGQCNGYCDRLHYISQWIEQGERTGLLYEVKGYAHKATQRLNLNFMSRHPDSYRQLKENPSLVKEIKKGEQPFGNISIEYIPKSLLNGSPQELSIADGDILAIVTAIEGLDVSHVGFALWQEGTLHLIHASSGKGETIIDEQPLFDYMKNKKNNLGVRVFRIK